MNNKWNGYVEHKLNRNRFFPVKDINDRVIRNDKSDKMNYYFLLWGQLDVIQVKQIIYRYD